MPIASLPEELPIADYILHRLVQLNVKTIFGVPGDFNLEFLDYIEDNQEITWAGNANELNAAYSADGYSRVSRGLSVLVTTFGVGELSALCGVAGMMAERLPLLHIVGAPSTKHQASRALLHHTLGDGTFTEFGLMSEQIAAKMTKLTKAEGAGQLIDDLIRVALRECRPVYLALPSDLVHCKIPSHRLNTSLPFPASNPPPPSAADAEITGDTKIVVDQIVSMYEKALDPILLFDACGGRFGMGEWCLRLCEALNIRYYLTSMSKATMPEHHELYGGCYIGANSLPAIQQLVEKSDCIISLGLLASDMNSGSFTWAIPTKHHVELHSNEAKIASVPYPKVSFRDVIPALLPRLSALCRKEGSAAANKAEAHSDQQRLEAVTEPTPEEHADDNAEFGEGAITHKYLWPTVKTFLQPWDCVITETGTGVFGILDIPFPNNAISLTQVLWGAIGWSVGATLGALMAIKDAHLTRPRRTILFVGDGALQLTVQEIGTMMRQKSTPYIFVLNNDGYEIEKQIHGPERVYNDIQPYDYEHLLPFFSPRVPRGQPKPADQAFYRCETKDDLEALLVNDEFLTPGKIRVIELIMPQKDAPRVCNQMCAGFAKSNRG